MYKCNYRKGREIISFEGLLSFLKKDGVVYLRDKVQNRKWVVSTQLRYLVDLMNKGLISRALKNRQPAVAADYEK